MAIRKEKDKNYKRYSQTLLDRIDNMPSTGDYSPYNPVKKQTMTNDELFDNSMYDLNDSDEFGIDMEGDSKGEHSNLLLIIVMTIILIILVAVLVFTVSKYL